MVSDSFQLDLCMLELLPTYSSLVFKIFIQGHKIGTCMYHDKWLNFYIFIRIIFIHETSIRWDLL